MTPAALNLQFLAQVSAERILNCTAEGMVIALLAWLVLRALGTQNSGTRFAVWLSALFGIAVLPLVSSWAGDWKAGGAGFTKPSEITMPGSWAFYIFSAWLLIAAAGLFRVGIGFWHLQRLRKSCVPVDVSALDPLLQKTLKEFHSPRAVKLCVSDRLQVPTAIGFMNPLVVIPSWTMRDLSAAELNTILLHELAHLRRRDDWTNLVQKVLGALLFFHPAVWWIEKKLALEREMACDDLVLAQTADPRAYAECLVSLAEKSLLRRSLRLAQAAVDRMKPVSMRVSQILDVNRPRATGIWSPAPLLVTGVSLVCLMGLSQAPTRLVSFDSGAASMPAANSVAAGNFDASEMSQAGARVVPAKLDVAPEQVQPEDRRSAAAVSKSAVRSRFKPTAVPAMVPANSRQHRVRTPALVRTSLAVDGVAPQTLFLVTQTEFVQTRQYDASGAVVWDLCVWRVTVVAPVQKKNTMNAGIVAKST